MSHEGGNQRGSYKGPRMNRDIKPIDRESLELIDTFLQATEYAYIQLGLMPTKKMVVDQAMKMYVDTLCSVAKRPQKPIMPEKD